MRVARRRSENGQSAIEYLILATAIIIVVLIGFDAERGFMVRARNMTETTFNDTLRNIMGDPAGPAARTTAVNYP